MTAHYVMVIIALVCFALAGLGVSAGRVSLLAFGLFFWLASSAL